MHKKYMEETKAFLHEPIRRDEIVMYICNKELINGVNVTEETLKEYTDEILEKLNEPFIESYSLGYIDVLLLSIIIRNNRLKRLMHMIPSVPILHPPPYCKIDYNE